MSIDLTVSLINHSNPELLRECLRSIYAGTHDIAFDVWVVDNATDGRLVPEMRAEFPVVRWLLNERRLGFSANHNQVLARAAGRYVCVLNDDTIVHDGALATLVAYMDANPDVGLVGPRLLNLDGSPQVSARRDVTLGYQLLAMCELPGLAQRWRQRWIHPAQYANEPRPVDWLLGACVLVRSSLLPTVGVLDAEMSPIANMEDVDWCMRMRRAQQRVVFHPDSRVTHYGGQSVWRSDGQAGRMHVEMCRAMLRYTRKHYGLAACALVRIAQVCTLPWNVLMLTQSWIRGRTGSTEYRDRVRIALALTSACLRPTSASRGQVCG